MTKNNGPGCCGCGGGGGGSLPYPPGSIPDCYCMSLPGEITMTSTDESCDYGSFQNCTILYGPTPSYFVSTLGANSFLSVQTFYDSTAGGAPYRYLLSCGGGYLYLQKAYPPGSGYAGSGGFFGGLIFEWEIGVYGNTCSPFYFPSGNPTDPGTSCAPSIVTLNG